MSNSATDRTYPHELRSIVAGLPLAGGGDGIDIIDPANEKRIGMLIAATPQELDHALEAAQSMFRTWRSTAPSLRSEILWKAAQVIRHRKDEIARLLTLEQGKPLMQSRLEVDGAAETFEWYAGEAVRAYGRIIPARAPGGRQMVLMEPIGPVAAFTPWNFPALLAARKIAAALAAGCTCIIKPAEETPASVLALGEALAEAGLPAGVLSIVFGDPGSVSAHLIASPVIRKISFTGSVPVGKQLAGLASLHAKPCTLELGGHAPVIILDDVDVAAVAAISAVGKLWNTGQVCTAPTRFYVHGHIYDFFVERFAAELTKRVIGDGLNPATRVGPLSNHRRLSAMRSMVADACGKGADIRTGGERIGETGYFFQPTLITGASSDTEAMRSEPFGPIALVERFDDLDEGIAAANRSEVGLAGYAFTNQHKAMVKIGEELEVGMIAFNGFSVANAEAPFGGVKESGYGYEGGSEGLQAYLHSKYVNHC